MQLVMLCREMDYKQFGPQIVFKRLIDDLKELEIQGFPFEDDHLKCRLYAIAGDNLGSHGIGGFTKKLLHE